MQGLELAVIGNCAIASLIGREGRHVWFCFPRLDGDPVFCALLGGASPEPASWTFRFATAVDAAQSYVPSTAVLETIDHRQDRREAQAHRLRAALRAVRAHVPAAAARAAHRAGAGRPRIRVRIRPRFNYGTVAGAVNIGSNHVRHVGPNATLRVTSDMPLSYILDETEFVLDRPLNLFVGADEPIPENPDTLAQSFLKETIIYWQGWVRGLSLPFDWQDEVIRSAITLEAVQV